MTISIASTTPLASSNGAAGASIEDFLRILTAQLNSQDPLKPVDNQEFVAQIAQFTSLEQTRQMNEKLDSLLSVQSTTQWFGLLGRNVDVNLNGAAMSGQVSALSLAGDIPSLSIILPSGEVQSSVSLADIVTVH